MITPPRLCAWCHEPFTPHRSRATSSVDGMTQTCQPSCAKKFSGQRAKANGSLAKATAARSQQANARIDALIPGLTPREAYRFGFARGYQSSENKRRRAA